jgi:hypothetical protein
MTDDTGDKVADQNYVRVFEQHAEGMFGQARHTLATAGVIDEPDLLRLVLARLLAQGEDASRHAAKAADLANAVARLVTMRRQGPDRSHSDLSQDVDAVLRDIESDHKAAHSASGVASPHPEGASQ